MPAGRVNKPWGRATPQEPTLRTSRPPFDRSSLELTRWGGPLGVTPDIYRKMRGLSQAERKDWYVETLGRYYDQLQESARVNHIPPQLLATILLNELADINVLNWAQHETLLNSHLVCSGSLGAGQIQVSTALKHGLFKGILDNPTSKTSACDVAALLAIPQYAIEATAREISYLLDLMETDPTQAWPAQFRFTPLSGDDWWEGDQYRFYIPGVMHTRRETKADTPDKDTEETDEDREVALAVMVASAYNGGENFIKKPSSNGNSIIHGQNAAFIARDLFEMRLFPYRRRRVVPAAPATVVKHTVVAGDTLSKLADKYYKDAKLWPIIYAANQWAIGNNPNTLKVGMQLIIPDLDTLSPAEITRAMASPPQPGTVYVAPLR